MNEELTNNEALMKKVVALLNEKWGNDNWKLFSEEEKLRIVKEFLDEHEIDKEQ